jgi:hypothetical protein
VSDPGAWFILVFHAPTSTARLDFSGQGVRNQ